MTGQTFEPQTRHMRKLVPFRVIVCAVAKDPEAMDQVIAHYNPYIIHLSNRPTRDEDGYFVRLPNSEIKARLISRLVRAVVQFKIKTRSS